MRQNCPVLAALVFVLTTCLLATTAAVEPSDTVQPVAPPRGELRGTVLDPQGEPLSGATVRVQRVRTAEDRKAITAGEDDTDSWRTSVVETSDEGTFHLRKLRGGKFAVRVEAEGLAPAFEPNAIPGTALTIRLKPGQELSGLVLDQQPASRSPPQTSGCATIRPCVSASRLAARRNRTTRVCFACRVWLGPSTCSRPSPRRTRCCTSRTSPCRNRSTPRPRNRSGSNCSWVPVRVEISDGAATSAVLVLPDPR